MHCGLGPALAGERAAEFADEVRSEQWPKTPGHKRSAALTHCSAYVPIGSSLHEAGEYLLHHADPQQVLTSQCIPCPFTADTAPYMADPHQVGSPFPLVGSGPPPVPSCTDRGKAIPPCGPMLRACSAVGKPPTTKDWISDGRGADGARKQIGPPSRHAINKPLRQYRHWPISLHNVTQLSAVYVLRKISILA